MFATVKRPINAIWSHRHFIVGAVRGEFKSRVARSRIGTLWFVLHPLAMALIYVMVLSEIIGAKLGNVDKNGGYAIFLLSGMTAWNLFAEIVNRCIGIFIEYSATLKKINFPKLCLPVIISLGALINQFLLIVSVAFIIAFYGYYPSFNWLLLLPIAAIIILMALGIGILLGVINVFARDVAQVMIVVMSVWFWLTPIVYTLDMVPTAVQPLIKFNPMEPLTAAYQDVILYEKIPDFSTFLYPITIGIGFFVLSYFVFRRANGEIVDAL